MKSDNTEIQFLPSGSQDSSTKTKYSLVSDENLSRRQVPIIDDVTEESFEQIKNLYDALIEINATEPIHFILGTVGGDVRSMLGIMNLILLSKTPCYTYLMGETCSAGSWIYLCGHKRFAPKTNLVSFMLHPMEWDRSDSLGNHASHNKYVEKISQNLVNFTAARTTISKEQLSRLATTETEYFVGNELFDCGISTDELTTSTFWIPEKKESLKKKPSKKAVLLTEEVK